MTTIRFSKAEGAQNDFVIVDDRTNILSPRARREFSQRVCHRRKGIGSDGTIFIVDSDIHDFTMEFYNPDGSSGSMCGNGGRCAALYAEQKGIASAEMTFDTLGNEYRAVVRGNDIQLFFPPPEAIELHLQLPLVSGAVNAHYLHTGAPHLVVFTEENRSLFGQSLVGMDIHPLGRELRMDKRFQPIGTNVNFIDIDSSGGLCIRTFEKGVEAETEACGTGTIASALAAHLLHGVQPPIRLNTHGGDNLTVGFDATGTGYDGNPKEYFSRNLFLSGPAHLVFEGEIEV